MTKKILFVDDDQNLLDGYKRTLRKEFEADYALGPENGLAAIGSDNEYAVVVADMRMPGMNGIEFLLRVKESSPDSIRMMLTGNADVKTAVEAVNQGNVFRFLTKPCPPDRMKEVLGEAIAEYEHRTRERDLASLDALTGLYNRKRLEEKLDEENERRLRYAEEKGIDYSIIFLDLDNFKHYNDAFGHPVGDLILKEFANILKGLIRGADFAARFGGDEFFILMPETDVKGAVGLAKRIKEDLDAKECFREEIEALAGKPIENFSEKRITCSIGIATVTSRQDTDLRTVMKRADDSVLDAKRSGKDCFVVWSPKY